MATCNSTFPERPSERGINSFAQILGRIADPVEPFSFTFVPHDLQLSPLDGVGDGLGKPPDLFGQLDEGQIDLLECVHGNFRSLVAARACFR